MSKKKTKRHYKIKKFGGIYTLKWDYGHEIILRKHKKFLHVKIKYGTAKHSYALNIPSDLNDFEFRFTIMFIYNLVIWNAHPKNENLKTIKELKYHHIFGWGSQNSFDPYEMDDV